MNITNMYWIYKVGKNRLVKKCYWRDRNVIIKWPQDIKRNFDFIKINFVCEEISKEEFFIEIL